MVLQRSAATSTGVVISNLTVSYRRSHQWLQVLKDISFEIEPGQAYGLVGESGCGKTTVAMTLMRYLPQNAAVQSGRITFAGEDLLQMDDARLRALRGDRIAMVYQDPGSALNPSLRVGVQIAEVFQTHRKSGKEAALESARLMLERVQMGDSAGIMRRYPHELSGGQQQRVMFAMALATDPDLLVLDEPTTGLDKTVEAEILELVAHLRSELHASILFISHNLEIVSRLCDRVGVLYAGRLVEEGKARDVLTRPSHPYTLGLLRCVPDASMRKHERRLEPIPGSLPSLGANPPGCIYADRCPIAADRCTREQPPAALVDTGHRSSCFFPDRVSTEGSESSETEPRAAEGSRLSASETPLLALQDLSKVYRTRRAAVHAVDQVSLHLQRGEILGLVGESGSGKSTLAKCIVGLVEPSDGVILFEETEIPRRLQRRSKAIHRKMQMVFQNPDTALNPNHTVQRILGRATALLRSTRRKHVNRETVVELAKSVRLEARHLSVRPSALSGGLKQRVAIARALAGSPNLVLCDEPTSALDVSVQAAILNLIADLQRKGLAFLIISHDLGVVRYLADRIAVMYLGQIIEVGTADAVFESPHHPYTDALLSAASLRTEGRPTDGARVPGAVPSAANPPSGCRYHTRCPLYLGELCSEQEPPWQDAGGNRYRCHIPPTELARVQRAAVVPEGRSS